jgi:hypothetical protein
MTCYKSRRIVDGKPRLVVVDENGKIIEYTPTKEELKGLLREEYYQGFRDRRFRRESYNETNTCPNIKDDGNICGKLLIPHYTMRERDKNGDETGRWLCKNCFSKYDPNGQWNLLRSVENRRTGNIDQDSTCGKGDKFQELTSGWRSTISTVPVEDLNKKLDNYNTPIDHSPDSELGIIQTRGRLYDHMKGRWSFSNLQREWNKNFDHEIFYCANKDGTLIERMYIFPSEEIEIRKSIDIIKNPTDAHRNSITPWYEDFRVKNEETIKKVNEIWKKIIDKK